MSDYDDHFAERAGYLAGDFAGLTGNNFYASYEEAFLSYPLSESDCLNLSNDVD